MATKLPLVIASGDNLQQLQAADTINITQHNLPLGRKNMVVNGNFDIWQRGTSFATVSTNTYGADGWVFNNSNNTTNTVTVAQDTSVPTASSTVSQSAFSWKLTIGTAITSPSSTNVGFAIQRIEGYIFRLIYLKPFVVSFWVKSNLTGTYCFSINSSGNDECYIAEYTINSANTWEFKTLAIPANPNSGTWNFSNGVGARFSFCVMGGSARQNTAGSWISSGGTQYFCTSNQVNLYATTSNNFALSQVQIEAGTVATPFEQTLYQQELELCQRYYWKTYDPATVPGTVTTAGQLLASAAGGNLSFDFPTTLRGTPTITLYSPNTGTSGKAYDGTTDQTATSSNASSTGFQALSTAGGYYYHVTADAGL